MVKAIELLSSAFVCSLVVLTCHATDPSNSDECKTSFFDELNESSSKEVEQKLKAVPEDQRDTRRIGKATVAQLLDLMDPECDKGKLYGGHVLSNEKNLYCGDMPNKGALAFFKKHFPKWQKICGQEVNEELKKRLTEFPEDHKAILESITDHRHKHREQKERDRIETVFKNQEGLFESCLNLYKQVPEFHFVIKLVDSSMEYIKNWSYKIQECEEYLDDKCRGYLVGKLTTEDHKPCEAYQEQQSRVLKLRKSL